MYCSNCGKHLVDNANFCSECGTPTNPMRSNADAPASSQSPTGTISLQKLKSRKKSFFIWSFIAVIVLVSVMWSVNYYSIENRLTRNTWWTEIEIYQEYVDWSSSGNGKGYATSLRCYSIVFEEWGKAKTCQYGYPDMMFKGGVVILSYKVSDNFDFSRFDWKKKDNKYENDWEILNNKVLLFNGEYYKWSKTVSDDTWYLSWGTLRIGEQYFTSKSPNID